MYQFLKSFQKSQFNAMKIILKIKRKPIPKALQRWKRLTCIPPSTEYAEVFSFQSTPIHHNMKHIITKIYWIIKRSIVKHMKQTTTGKLKRFLLTGRLRNSFI